MMPSRLVVQIILLTAGYVLLLLVDWKAALGVWLVASAIFLQFLARTPKASDGEGSAEERQHISSAKQSGHRDQSL